MVERSYRAARFHENTNSKHCADQTVLSLSTTLRHPASTILAQQTKAIWRRRCLRKNSVSLGTPFPQRRNSRSNIYPKPITSFTMRFFFLISTIHTKTAQRQQDIACRHFTVLKNNGCGALRQHKQHSFSTFFSRTRPKIQVCSFNQNARLLKQDVTKLKQLTLPCMHTEG